MKYHSILRRQLMIKFDFSTYIDSKVEVDTNEKQKL